MGCSFLPYLLLLRVTTTGAFFFLADAYLALAFLVSQVQSLNVILEISGWQAPDTLYS